MSEYRQQNPGRKRRKRRSKFQRFLRRYFHTIALLVMCVVCISVVLITVSTVSSVLSQKPTEPTQPHLQATEAQPTEDTRQEDAEKLILQADKLAAGYDYTGAIKLLQSFDGFENYSVLTDKINDYTEEDQKLVH